MLDNSAPSPDFLIVVDASFRPQNGPDSKYNKVGYGIVILDETGIEILACSVKGSNTISKAIDAEKGAICEGLSRLKKYLGNQDTSHINVLIVNDCKEAIRLARRELVDDSFNTISISGYQFVSSTLLDIEVLRTAHKRSAAVTGSKVNHRISNFIRKRRQVVYTTKNHKKMPEGMEVIDLGYNEEHFPSTDPRSKHYIS